MPIFPPFENFIKYKEKQQCPFILKNNCTSHIFIQIEINKHQCGFIYYIQIEINKNQSGFINYSHIK